MFKYIYKIQEKDINEGNHVGNERALLYFQWGRTEFLKQFGLSQINIGDNAGLIQLNSYVEYRAQLFLGQEIEIKVDSIEINGFKLIFNYTINIKENDKLAISGYTTMACFDYDIQKIRKIPDSFLEILNNLK